MSFPEYADLEKPLLCYIYFHGGSNYRVETGSTYRPLANYFGLSTSERLQTVSDIDPDLKWNNMVRWARNSLRKHGYLADSPRGVWQLSDAGVMAAQLCASAYSALK